RVHGKLREAFGDALALVDLFSHPTIESLTERIQDRRDAERAAAPRRERVEGSSDVAVIGIACRFPGAANVDEFWGLLRDGHEATKRFSAEQLVTAGVEPELIGDPHFVAAGGVIDGIELFDAGFFGYSAREAQMMDPQQRIFLEAAWEVIERAGYDSEQFSG